MYSADNIMYPAGSYDFSNVKYVEYKYSRDRRTDLSNDWKANIIDAKGNRFVIKLKPISYYGTIARCINDDSWEVDEKTICDVRKLEGASKLFDDAERKTFPAFNSKYRGW